MLKVSYGNYRETITQLILAGGDTDSTAALAGALSGLMVGYEGIPNAWLDGACGWPLTFKYLRKLSQALAARDAGPIKTPSTLLLFIRNVVLLPIFMIHLVRRMVGI